VTAETSPSGVNGGSHERTKSTGRCQAERNCAGDHTAIRADAGQVARAAIDTAIAAARPANAGHSRRARPPGASPRRVAKSAATSSSGAITAVSLDSAARNTAGAVHA
jgi:hypothetical protein